MYVFSLEMMAQRFGVKYYLQSDDTQLYLSLNPDIEIISSSSLRKIEHRIAKIRQWMTQILLRLNDDQNIYDIFGLTTLC